MASDLPSSLKKLSSIDRKLFVKTFDILQSKGISEEESFDKALFSVGKTSDDLTTHSLSQDINLQTVIVKEGGFFNKNYFFDATLSSSSVDSDNQSVSNSLLKWLDDNDRVDSEGDIKHLAANGNDSSWKGLFKLMHHSYQNDKLDIKFSANKEHPKFKEFLVMHKEDPFTMLSAEFQNPRMIGNKIVYSDRIGWTLTTQGRASNKDARIKKGK